MPRRHAVRSVVSLAVIGLVGLLMGPTATAAPHMVAVPPQVAPDPNAKITFFAGLPYNGAALTAAARQIASPGSAEFRQHLSLADARKRFGATPAAVAKLRKAASDAGLTVDVDGTGLFARLTGSVAQWERLMGSSVQFSSAQTQVFMGQAANDVYTFSDVPLFTTVSDIPLPSQASLEASTYSPAPKELAPAITWFLPSFARYVPSADSGQSGSGGQFAESNVLIYPDSGTTPFPTNTATPIGTSCVASGATTINGASGPAGQEVFYTPDQVSQAYGMGGLQRKHGAAASGDVALISFNGGFLPSDVQDAANCFGHRAPEVRVTRGTGVSVPFNNVDGETSLDLQTASWVLKNARSLRLVQVTNSATAFLDGYSRLLTDPAGPPVSASLSYGNCEPGMNSLPGWRTQDDLFALAGVLGTSLFVSAGDTGSAVCQVGDLLGVDMLAESIVAALGESNVPPAVFEYLEVLAQAAAQQAASPASTVSYPASSPWVTAVGATQLVLGDQNSIVRESPWNDLQYGVNGNAVTTGGPSMIYARPWYQPGFTSADRRLVPDISAMGALTPAMPLYVSGQLGIVAGTSESSPMMAAAMALVSKQREAAGKERLGFINPWLYRTAQSHPSVFRDITDGNNQYPVPYAPGSLNVMGCCEAVEGFDTASGLGSINFERLAKVAR